MLSKVEMYMVAIVVIFIVLAIIYSWSKYNQKHREIAEFNKWLNDISKDPILEILKELENPSAYYDHVDWLIRASFMSKNHKLKEWLANSGPRKLYNS